MASPATLKNPSGLRVVVTLTMVAAIAAALLAVVDGLTREKIAEAQLAAKVEAMSSLLPAFDGNPFQSGKEYKRDAKGAFALNEADADPATCAKDAFCVYEARKAAGGTQQLVGYGVETWSKQGYSGLVKLLVVTDAEGHIVDVITLEARETPGLGTKAAEEPFRAQFKGKGLGGFRFSVQKDGGDVEAITSATITSRAYSEAIEVGLRVLNVVNGALQGQKEARP